MRKRILFINHEETRTGSPKVLFEIAKYMKIFFDVSVVSLEKGSMHEEFQREFDDIQYPAWDSLNRTPAEAARECIRKAAPDLVYVNSCISFVYAKEAKKLRIPTVFHIHELKAGFRRSLLGRRNSGLSRYRSLYRIFSAKIRWSIKKTLKRRKYYQIVIDAARSVLRYVHRAVYAVIFITARFNFRKWSDIYIAASEAVREFLILEIRCAPSRVITVNDFISFDTTIDAVRGARRETIDAELQKAGSKKVVLSVGAISKRKGVDILNDAVREVKEKGFDSIDFFWIGRAPRGENIPRVIREGGERIIFLGEKENPLPYIEAADIFALPSREDPFPLVVLEAMALGKPVVTFQKNVGISEVVREGCGLVVKGKDPKKFADAIIKLSNDPELRKKLGETGRRKQRELYDASQALPAVKNIVTQLLNDYVRRGSGAHDKGRSAVR